MCFSSSNSEAKEVQYQPAFIEELEKAVEKYYPTKKMNEGREENLL